ncbi:MAG: TatD family hydrolase [Planctomycetaceae bacterium]|jgi:TatD DNase family protein|nr:TatD family hydrolase [Planctomycetaceae bacterium]
MNLPVPIFDTHAHLDLEPFNADRADVVRRLESGTFPGGNIPEALTDQPVEVIGAVIPGIEPATWQNVLETVKLSDRFYAAVAVHPNHTAGITEKDMQMLAELVRQKEVSAVGETGLDRYRNDAPIDIQQTCFRQHIELSKETGKPVLIHCRDAWDDLLPVLKSEKPLTGILHAFSGGPAEAAACLESGLMISFAGSVTYRNVNIEAVKSIPADRLLIETDAPFMVPLPFRGKLKRNEPVLASLAALRLAEIWNVPLRHIAEVTAQNALRLFRR